ncbi:MAG: ABC transporter [Sphingobium sp.]|nr:MAG: ABC transporter [Sphingobium sp.]
MVTIHVESARLRIGRRDVLRGIDLSLAAGTLTGIVGPNGAGKSTLLRAILGLARLEGGRVLLDGAPITAMKRAAIARRIAYLPQGQTLHWPLGVERLVALGRLPHLGPMSRLTPGDTAAIEEALERADAVSLRSRIATELSGGERARVLLARALAVGAPALLADEPLASLDPGHQIDVMALLRQEADRGGLVVTVLHDLTMAARYCDRLILIDEGRCVADGAPMDVLTPERLAAVYGIHAFIDASGTAPMIVPTERGR